MASMIAIIDGRSKRCFGHIEVRSVVVVVALTDYQVWSGTYDGGGEPTSLSGPVVLHLKPAEETIGLLAVGRHAVTTTLYTVENSGQEGHVRSRILEIPRKKGTHSRAERARI